MHGIVRDINLPYEKVEPLYRTEQNFEWKKWCEEIPYLAFPSGWLVKAVPPFVTGIIRYRITKRGFEEKNFVSVYLDCYDQAGIVGEPYWEVHRVDGDCVRCLLNETDELLNVIAKGLSQLGASP